MQKILIGHLGSFGDCLYATAIARQIKSDYPACHLTWAIGAKYQSVIFNNPFIDKIWVIENNDYYFEGWELFEKECDRLKNEGVFDLVFFTQIYPHNLCLFNGTIRGSILNAYPKKISNVTPVMELTSEEIRNVDSFISKNNLKDKQIIVFEFAPNSRQSFVSTQFAIEASILILQKVAANFVVVLSSHLKIETNIINIIDGSSLSFRENAELLNRAKLFIGCSSGLTWLSTSNWVKTIPTIQLLNPNAYWFAGVIYDFEYYGIDHQHIIELKKCKPDYLAHCVDIVTNDGIQKSKLKYNWIAKPKYFYSYRHLHYQFLSKFQFQSMKTLHQAYSERHGFKIIFVIYTILNILLLPLLPLLYLQKTIAKTLKNV